MKASEVMLGNWVMKPSREDRESLVKGQIELEDFYLEEEWETISNCLPIPLTDEILEKNGFIETKETHIIEDLGVAIIYGKYERLDEDKMLCHGNSLWPIKYVHQLQNALCLCGVNKEIVL